MKITIIAGSNRKDATSTRAAEYAADRLARQGHSIQLFDLYKQPLPMYSPDHAPDEATVRLQHAMLEANAVILATPEYHGSISGALKNALDYLGQSHFGGKTVLSISSAGGPIGVSSLQQLQAIVRNLHGINSPEWISIGGAQRSAFEQKPVDYDLGTGSGIMDRVHRALDTFTDLAVKLSVAHTART